MLHEKTNNTEALQQLFRIYLNQWPKKKKNMIISLSTMKHYLNWIGKTRIHKKKSGKKNS